MTTPINRTIRKTNIGSTDSFFSSIEFTHLSDPKAFRVVNGLVLKPPHLIL